MKILVINGANLNMLGIREKSIYGDKDYKELIRYIKNGAKEKGVKIKCYQSNCEGEIVNKIQRAYKKFDGIIINPGAYTHTSIAILDALKSVQIPTVEVHISAIEKREDFRQFSYISQYAFKTITGQGFDGYLQAIDQLKNR
jgi:3-dehydroquinate dehydratase-2